VRTRSSYNADDLESADQPYSCKCSRHPRSARPCYRRDKLVHGRLWPLNGCIQNLYFDAAHGRFPTRRSVLIAMRHEMRAVCDVCRSWTSSSRPVEMTRRAAAAPHVLARLPAKRTDGSRAEQLGDRHQHQHLHLHQASVHAPTTPAFAITTTRTRDRRTLASI
jgi:hypothetical protein